MVCGFIKWKRGGRAQERREGQRPLRKREENCGPGLHGSHEKLREFFSDCFPPRFSEQGEPAAKHHSLRMKEVRHVRKSKGQSARDVVQQISGPCVACLQRCAEVACFATGICQRQLGENTRRMLRGEPADARIHGAAGADIFHDGATLIEPQVPEFRLARLGAMVDLALEDQPATDPCAGVRIEDRAHSRTCTESSLRESCSIRVVLYQGPAAGDLFEPLRKWKSGPAFHMHRAADLSRAPAHRPTKPNASSRKGKAPAPLVQHFSKIASNTFSAFFTPDAEPCPLENCSIRRADHRLRLRPADLDPKQQRFPA
jgi:hypothetical protein